jgi:hypothetical protein
MLRTYDLFEVMPDGDLIWRAKIDGDESAVYELLQAAKRSRNEFRLMHIPSMAVIATMNAKVDSALGNKYPLTEKRLPC